MSSSAPPVTLLTAPGTGGVAVLSVHGDPALARLRSLASGALPAVGEVRLAVLRDPGDAPEAPPLDEALLVGRGDRVEVHTHGSPAIVSAVTSLLDGGGAEPARIPLEERAELAAASAPTATGARILLDQAEGALRRALEALLEVDAEERTRGLAALARAGERCARLWVPTTVALVGPVNAGKSTLFNALLGEEVATVTRRAGTTRDALAAPAELDGWPVMLVDTAGERDLTDEVRAGDRGAAVEVAGQRLAREAAARAGLVLALDPGSHGIPGASGEPGGERAGGDPPRVSVRSRAAESEGPDPASWGPRSLSALEQPEHARARVAALFRGALGLGDRPAWVPGEAVPFEVTTLQQVVDLATGAGAERSALASLIDSL